MDMKRLYSLALAAAVSASFVMIAIAPADADHGTQVTGASSFTSRHLPASPPGGDWTHDPHNPYCRSTYGRRLWRPPVWS